MKKSFLLITLLITTLLVASACAYAEPGGMESSTIIPAYGSDDTTDQATSPPDPIYDTGSPENTPTPNESNELMGNASAEYSAFIFYIFDGETVLSKVVFQSVPHRQGIIDLLQSVPASRVTDWTLDDITLPIYGIEMGTTCGFGIRAAWSNGYWITETGDVYRFDFDFETFIEGEKWESPHSVDSIAFLPNAVFLTRDEDGWRDTLMIAVTEELNPPEGIDINLVSSTDDEVIIELTNNNDSPWYYGRHFRLDVLLNGVWYNLPTMPGNWEFTDDGLVVASGETETKTYNLMMYGQLLPGTYRLVMHDMYVVFEID